MGQIQLFMWISQNYVFAEVVPFPRAGHNYSLPSKFIRPSEVVENRFSVYPSMVDTCITKLSIIAPYIYNARHHANPYILSIILPYLVVLYLFIFSLPVFLSLEHGLDAVRERGNDPGRCGLERDGLSAEVDAGRVNWRVMEGRFRVGVVTPASWWEGLGEGERVTPRAPVSGTQGGGGGAMVREW